MCVGVVQGLSLAFNTPTLGFSTLEVLAYGGMKKYNSKNIAVAIDARMGEVYWGFYKKNKLQNESLKKPNEVDTLGEDFIGVGTGWGAYEQELSKKSGITTFYANFHPKADNLIDLALVSLKNGKILKNELPLPTYLRNNVAKKSSKQ
jgi:tRNA threonylcarbamoyladenosine biosynthesis protein TsaB